jgi:hypothetical protein
VETTRIEPATPGLQRGSDFRRTFAFSPRITTTLPQTAGFSSLRTASRYFAGIGGILAGGKGANEYEPAVELRGPAGTHQAQGSTPIITPNDRPKFVDREMPHPAELARSNDSWTIRPWSKLTRIIRRIANNPG